ncbi:MAG: adenosylcobinamide-GDP ribazoletransferase [Oscillospiraceae bacterium]|jgi:adenosylcobinamide-GDP ribazoletransferase|nr:adenosylcobinamide-GDP ribazoletransferase [Oscillospiraceae bacterium]
MFSRIPMPRIEWDEGIMRHMMTAFPLVGAVIGGIMFAFLRLADYFELHDALRALGMTLLPLAVTGGIHLDGLCDTCDALGAVVSPERRREILKDPRAGAFGVIGVVTYLLAYFALALAFDGSTSSAALYCFGFVISRAFSAFAVVNFKPASDGTGRAFHDAAGKNGRFEIFVAFILVLIAFFIIGVAAALSYDQVLPWVLVTLVCNDSLWRTAKKKFEGMSGDLAGWFLQRCELWQLGALVIVSALAR